MPVKARVDNILTKIRLIEGVATVTQVRAIKKADVTHRSAEILIKCHPGLQAREEFITKLTDAIRSIDNVQMIRAKFINDVELSRALSVKRDITARRI